MQHYQSASDTAALNAEAAALGTAIDQIVTKATFNGVVILSKADLTRDIGVTDDGGTVTLKTSKESFCSYKNCRSSS